MELSLLGWGANGWGDELVRGAVMTFLVALGAFALSLVFGTIFALCKRAKNVILRAIADLYTTIMRGIPELLIIYLVFFGGGVFLQNIAQSLFGIGGQISLPVFFIGVFCIALSAGSYATEVIRGAIEAVPKGQIEAADAIGMRPSLRFRRIIFPQSMRFALPALTNIWQYALKETSLISVIGLAEIMFTAKQGAGSTREPFTFYISAFLLFLLLAWGSQQFFNQAEKWAARGTRKA